jgi:hypothetical protein
MTGREIAVRILDIMVMVAILHQNETIAHQLARHHQLLHLLAGTGAAGMAVAGAAGGITDGDLIMATGTSKAARIDAPNPFDLKGIQ